jgi:poly(A) polymerase
LKDLESKVLRTPLDPEATFRDDPLRMLRAVRFRWQLGFTYAPGLAEAVKDQAHRLKVISAERVRDELVKMLALPAASGAMKDLLELNLLVEIAPEMLPMVGCEQGGYHHLDVWDHTLLALDNAGSEDLTTSLAVLLHDVGKPSTRTKDEDGRTRFFGHETVGEQMARRILRRLKFGNDIEDRVALLVKNHMRLNSMDRVTPSAARRIVRDLGPDLDRWLHLIEADAGALKPGVRALDLLPVRSMLESVREATPAETLDSPLSGEAIMGLTGLGQGPEIGRLKAALAEDVIEGRLEAGDETGAKARLMEHLRNARD